MLLGGMGFAFDKGRVWKFPSDNSEVAVEGRVRLVAHLLEQRPLRLLPSLLIFIPADCIFTSTNELLTRTDV